MLEGTDDMDSAGVAALVRIPAIKALLKTDDFFRDCVPIAIRYVTSDR